MKLPTLLLAITITVCAELHAEVPDAVLSDQHGQSVHFLTEVAQDRLVAVSFIFTSCTTICPVIGATLGKVEKLLDGHAGRDILLVSVSVDPVTDTPQRLSAWSAKFGAGPGWTLLTGAKRDVDTLRNALGEFSPDKQLHTDTIIIGRASNGKWTQVSRLQLPSAEKLAKLLKELSAQ